MYKGWKFKGPRLDNEIFTSIVNDIYNPHHVLTHYTASNLLVLTRGYQTVLRVQIDGDFSQWGIIYPMNMYQPFNYHQIGTVAKLIKNSRKV